MCGITGFLNIDGAPARADLAQAMTDAIAHRGPDGEGLHVKGAVALGHRRLAVIDTTDAGRQPMATFNGRFVLTYNGELFNYLELRRELESLGCRFHSRSDTEVVLQALSVWGIGSVKRFNGMFAFALYDHAKQRLYLCRDRYGVKPIYYCQTARAFLFGSEIKALIAHPAMTVHIEPAVLLQYFTFQNVFTDDTLFRGVKLLPHGCWADVGADGIFKIHRYWDYDFSRSQSSTDTRAYEDELHRLFEQAVHRQLMSDVPVGAYLSGGMDSGAITAVAARSLPHLISITGGFDMSSSSGLEMGADERPRAERLSYLFQSEHYEVVLKAGDLRRVLPTLTWHLEDLRMGQSYPNFYVAKLASKFAKVMLAGTGGDEMFGGYPWRYYRYPPVSSADDFIDNYFRSWQRMLPAELSTRFFRSDVWTDMKDISARDILHSVFPKDFSAPQSAEEAVNLSLYFECKTFLHGLLVVEDRLSMAHGLETRVPFLDNDLVDFAQTVPVAMKLRDIGSVIWVDENALGPKEEKTNDGKILLRNMLKRFLPEDYTTGVKQGFSGPDGSWFRGDSVDYIRQTVLQPDAPLYEFLDHKTVSELVDQHLHGKQNRRLLIWSLLSFNTWCADFLHGMADAHVSGAQRNVA